MRVEIETPDRKTASNLLQDLGERLAPEDSAEETLEKLRKLRSEIASEGDIRRRVCQLEALRERARGVADAE